MATIAGKRSVQVTSVLLVVLLLLGAIQAAALSADDRPDAVAGCPCALGADLGTPICVDMESLTLGTTYSVGDVFVESGAIITARPFTWSSGTPTPDGYARVQGGGMAGGSGKELQVNNINLSFGWAGVIPGLWFRFGEYGGNINININGQFRNVADFQDLNGLTIGGVEVYVINGAGNDAGRVRLVGDIASFVVGGQELFIDDVCPQGSCIDFEDLVAGQTYYVDYDFADSGYHMSLAEFTWTNGSTTDEGSATVRLDGLSGGSGLDLSLNNINLVVDIPEPWSGLVLDFGEYGGNLNLSVNGDSRNFLDMDNIDGQVIGGARAVSIGGGGQGTGKLYLFGEVSEFAIGGQEFAVDNICPLGCCVDFESLSSGTTFHVGDSFDEGCAVVSLWAFEWSNGTPTPSGYAAVATGGSAGGSGLELMVNNINVGVDFGETLAGLSLLFGEYGGNVNVNVNGDMRNVQNLSQLDGVAVGGAMVHVVNGYGNDRGRMVVEGDVSLFRIGGQELLIDHICPEFPDDEATPTATPRATTTPTDEKPTLTPTDDGARPTATATMQGPSPTATGEQPYPETTPTGIYSAKLPLILR